MTTQETSEDDQGETHVRLDEIDAIDAKGGLARMCGNEELYRKLLQQFVQEYTDTRPTLPAAPSEQEVEDVQRWAHSLKGVCGNLGILGVQEAAGCVANAIRRNTTDTLPELLTSLTQELDETIQALGQAGFKTAEPADVARANPDSPPSTQDPCDSTAPPRDASSVSATIMIVDDTPINLRLLEGMLKKKGYRTHAFTSGQRALDAAAKDPPDLILLDIKMPEMNGYEVCQALKELDQTRDIPVIFISALNELEDKMTAFTAGGVDYITKPFQFAEVQARVETHLQIRQMQAELRRHNLHLQELVEERVRAILETKRELEHAQHATILAMSKIAETRDRNTGKHIDRTQQYCYALSIKLRENPAVAHIIDDDFIENIRRASPLHDIGKVAIPDGILLKTGELTHDEFEIMKSHTTIGANNLKSVLQQHPNNAFVAMGVVIAQSHHEKWDGQGYPEGLGGNQIPLSAQIMAVADVYDALRTERSYKQGLSHEESRDIILAETGIHFSPAVSAAFAGIEKEMDHICQHLEDE